MGLILNRRALQRIECKDETHPAAVKTVYDKKAFCNYER